MIIVYAYPQKKERKKKENSILLAQELLKKKGEISLVSPHKLLTIKFDIQRDESVAAIAEGKTKPTEQEKKLDSKRETSDASKESETILRRRRR